LVVDSKLRRAARVEIEMTVRVYLLAIVLGVWGVGAQAAMGSGADPTFGAGGKVEASTGSQCCGLVARSARLSDGSTVVAGGSPGIFFDRFDVRGRRTVERTTADFPRSFAEVLIGGVTGGPRDTVILTGLSGPERATQVTAMRLLADGEPDTSFGTAGIADINAPFAPTRAPAAAAVDDAGRVAIGGQGSIGGKQRSFVVVLDAAGKPDPGFGEEGRAVVGPEGADVRALAFQPDGELLVAGAVSSHGKSMPIVTRLSASGQPDTSFGHEGGSVTLRARGKSAPSAAGDVAVSGGRILIGGTTRGTTPGFGLEALTASGLIDATFGRSGIADAEFPVGAVFEGMKVGSDGKLIAAGTTGPEASRSYAVARFTPAGRLDATFGGTGRDCYSAAPGRADLIAGGVTVQPDGKVVVAGFSGSPGGDEDGVLVTRFLRSPRDAVACASLDFGNLSRTVAISALLSSAGRVSLLVARIRGVTRSVNLGDRASGTARLRWDLRYPGRPTRPAAVVLRLHLTDARHHLLGEAPLVGFQIANGHAVF
jgi:uncharacterized delta-60 repeat protein